MNKQLKYNKNFDNAFLVCIDLKLCKFEEI